MRLSQTPVFVLLSCLFFAACTTPPKQEENKDLVSAFHGLLPQLMQSDTGVFHGVELGMTPSEVKQHMLKTDSLSMEEKDYLLFEGHLAPHKEYTWECTFDEKGLKDISLDIHLKDEPNADSLVGDFRRYFRQKYGAPVDSSKTVSWVTSEGKRPAKISLEEETDYAYGELSITFYDKTFDQGPPLNDSLLRPDSVPPVQ